MIARIIRLPVVHFLIFLIAGSLLHTAVPVSIGVPSFEIAMYAGVAMLIVSISIASAALYDLKRHGTTAEPGQRPTALVTSGVFSFSRNPLYVVLLLVLLAIAVMADSLWLVLSSALLWLTLDRVVVRAEERILEETFADEYGAYKRRVKRWV